MTAVRAELARLSRHAGIRALLLAQAAIWLALAVVPALDADRGTLAGGESQAALSGLGQVLSELGFWAVAPQLPLALGALAGAWRPGRPRPPQAATSAAAALLVMAATVLLLV